MHGHRPNCGDALQPFRRLGNRPAQSENGDPASSVVLISLVLSSALFVFFAANINRLTFVLSPVALGIIFFYSLTKHFTDATHFFLGFALGIAPVAAWIAQTGRVQLPPLILAFGVVCWVSGFDLIYATQDYDFDRREGLHSLVVRLGLAATLRIAQGLHFLMLIALIGFGIVATLGAVYFAGMIPIAVTLIYEHRSARALDDVASINRAFFNSNAFVSAVFLAAVCADRML
ncbi:MAG: 4-hydroxybenzoate octaprenyltransferase [Verrucomicrobia bacterium]|nr:MAG: 4-hydroxybenzoate octaprenyltransferase [Verrucomicrobiota bacterium]